MGKYVVVCSYRKFCYQKCDFYIVLYRYRKRTQRLLNERDFFFSKFQNLCMRIKEIKMWCFQNAVHLRQRQKPLLEFRDNLLELICWNRLLYHFHAYMTHPYTTFIFVISFLGLLWLLVDFCRFNLYRSLIKRSLAVINQDFRGS